MIGQEIVYKFLKNNQIPFDYYEHPEAPTIEIAAQYYRGEGTTLCKNLFFRNHKGNKHYLVIIECHKTLPIHDLEKVLHQGKLSFASPERMERCLGTTPGSVSLFGLINDPEKKVKLFLDKDLMEAGHISFHPNDNTATAVIPNSDFRRFLELWGGEYELLDLDNIA